MEETVEVNLGYFKQGDDLSSHLRKRRHPKVSFSEHAKQMREVADHLDKISAILAQVPNKEIDVDAGTHSITITCPKKIAKELIRKKLADNLDWVHKES